MRQQKTNSRILTNQIFTIFFFLTGCGVTTSSSGVKIDIDEDPPYRPTSNLTDASRPWWPTGNNNPSIGEVSLGASLSMGSGCILENAGMFFCKPSIWFLPEKHFSKQNNFFSNLEKYFFQFFQVQHFKWTMKFQIRTIFWD